MSIDEKAELMMLLDCRASRESRRIRITFWKRGNDGEPQFVGAKQYRRGQFVNVENL